MADPADNMASFDSPVYERDDDIGSSTIEATTENQSQQMDSDELNITSTSTHSDASTLPKDSPGLNGVDNNQNTDDSYDDDEHEYTYPDGLTGGTFDAPAPTSALINANKTENVMLKEVVISDSRHTQSLPDYYDSAPSKTKPYKFYGKFHSTYRICKIFGFIFLALAVVATCTILVLRVSVDHEIFDDEEGSTVVAVKEMTYRFTSSIAVTQIGGNPIVFSEALNDKESDEYIRVADEVQNSMDDVYRTGDLSDAYERSIVTNIRFGSVIVDIDLIFKSTKIIPSNKVESEIQNELARNSNVIGEIMIDPESVSVTDYDAQHPTTNPSVKPATASSTVMPVIDNTVTSQLSEITSTYEENTVVQFQTTSDSMESTSLQEESVTPYTEISESSTESKISDKLTSIEPMEPSSSDFMTDSSESTTNAAFIETTIAPAESSTPYIPITLKPTSKPITTSLIEGHGTSPEEPKTTEEDVRPPTTESPDDYGSKTFPIVTTSLEYTQSITGATSGFSSEYSTEEDCAEDEILCSNTTCISIDTLCNSSYKCIENGEQYGCSIGVNSTCAQQRELLLKVSAYYNETIFWLYSCLDDGSWDPLQCIPSENECFCVDEYGFDIGLHNSTYDNKPNCTEAVSTLPPVLGSK
ncbi:uncharacterized protein LOC117103087 isoform X2 [Anneissia japonica]|uniref:uncharacterized protein LOC117103087 isoform X2 n=1 Tax=Anneissia japonica TaxID=1529436 RepID=UPI0014256C5F|nr:uncharacterized protein LOC117103087 isoform X2 [Anneissia japonica]